MPCLTVCTLGSRSVLVLKKLGTELQQEFIEVINWLNDEEHMQVVTHSSGPVPRGPAGTS